MFCKNCGKELENSAKFCDNCGAPQTEMPVSQPDVAKDYAPQNTVPQGVTQNNPVNASVPYNANAPQQPIKPKKSSTGCIVAIIIACVIFALAVIGVIGIIVFSVNTSKDVASNPEFTLSDDLDVSDYVDENVEVQDDVANADYLEIFSSHNIVDSPSLFIGLESRAFASVLEDGTIDKMEFAYDNDTVEELIETIYYPIADVDESLVDDLDKSMKESFADADALDFCTVTYETTSDYYIIKIHSTEMDNATNLKALSDASVLVYDGFLTSLSMDQTADNLISDGYIER